MKCVQHPDANVYGVVRVSKDVRRARVFSPLIAHVQLLALRSPAMRLPKPEVVLFPYLSLAPEWCCRGTAWSWWKGAFGANAIFKDVMCRFVTQYNDIGAHSYKSTYDSVPDRPEVTLAKAKMDRTRKPRKRVPRRRRLRRLSTRDQVLDDV